MSIERIVFTFAGFMIALSVILGLYVHPYWFALTLFIAFNMVVKGLTNFCAFAIILAKLGFKSSCQ